MDGQKQTYEQFKADILQWKDMHREEYRRFAKMMADGNEMPLPSAAPSSNNCPESGGNGNSHGVTTARTASGT